MLRDELLRRFPLLASLPPHAQAVGGAVRDLLLGRTPVDVDVECDDPQWCAAGLGKVIPLGRGELKVFRVVVDDRVYDFSATTDLGRRDFTINAIAVDLTTGEMRDPFGGQQDIRRRVLRMIDAQNFQDDPLRMLRAVRLAVQFGLTVEEETAVVIRRRAAQIVTVAAERVTYELHAIFSTPAFRTALRLFNETALDEPLFGYGVDAHRFHSDEISLASAYALVLRDPQSFAKRWRWSDALLRNVLTLQRLLRDPHLFALFDAGEAIAFQLTALFRAIGRPPPEMPVFSTKSLLNGDEISKLASIDPGPRLGSIKRALLEAQLLGKVRTRVEAEQFVRSAR